MVKDISNSGKKIKNFFDRELGKAKKKFEKGSKKDSIDISPKELPQEGLDISSLVKEEELDISECGYEMIALLEEVNSEKKPCSAKEWITKLRDKFQINIEESSKDILGSIRKMSKNIEDSGGEKSVSALIKVKGFFEVFFVMLIGFLKLAATISVFGAVLMFSHILILSLISLFFIVMLYRAFMKTGPIFKVKVHFLPDVLNRMLEDWNLSLKFLNAIINSSDFKNSIYLIKVESSAVMGLSSRSTLQVFMYSMLNFIAQMQKSFGK